MEANVIVFVFCCLMPWLLYHFRLRKVAATAEIRKLLPFFLVLVLFLAFNGFLAWRGRVSLAEAVDAMPVTTVAGLERAETSARLILDGTVSPQNPASYWDYVAYLDNGHLYTPSELLIDLADGVFVVSNDDYEANNWNSGTGYYPHLVTGEPVIVVGTVERGVYVLDERAGQESISIRADIVFAGSHADFVERAQNRIILPTIMVAANLATIAAVALLLALSCLRSSKA